MGQCQLRSVVMLRMPLVWWVICTFFRLEAKAQLFTELGGGVGLQGVTSLYIDSMNDRLLLSGSFAYANDTPVSPGILEWSTAGFMSIGCGVAWDCVTPLSLAGLGNPALATVMWNNEIYLAGAFFFTRDGTEYERIMRWDGTNWHPMGEVNGPVKSIKVIDGQLIVAGWFTHADTVLANGLARWDGTAWHRVVDVPQFYAGDINRVQDVEKFQGEWYLGGNMSEMHELARYNGTTWEIVGGGFLGSFAQVNRLQAHGGKLYVGGSFAQCPPLGVPSNPGSGIVAWDGNSWDDLGGGTCGAANGAVNSILWWNDDLYVTGLFNRIGGQEGHGLAKWDGAEWCMLFPPGYFGTGHPGALAAYHDSLYIGGGFLVAGDDSVSCFGKWVGGDYSFACGTLAGIEDPETKEPVLSLSPNPTTTSITLHGLPSQTGGITVYDVLGRSLMREPVRASLDIQLLPAGTYTIVVRDAREIPLGIARFVKY